MKKKPCKNEKCEEVRYGNTTVCRFHFFERTRLKKEEAKRRKLERKHSTKKYQKSQKKSWKTKCWTLMSLWIRKKDADWRGNVSCYTCDVQMPWKEAHAGHMFHNKLDFDDRNIHVQCPQDNVYQGGRLDEYTFRLIKEHGMEWFEQLRVDAARHEGYSLEELKEIHADLTEKLKGI